MRLAPVFALLLASASFAATSFRIAGPAGAQRVDVIANGIVHASTPADGVWSIACDWRDGWPADWHHAAPLAIETAGEWTILKGRLDACGGAWQLRDAYKNADGVVKVVRRFEWKGTGTAPKVTLAVRFQAPARKVNLLLPGILYYGNPSGARSGKVPVFSGKPGEESVYEEHRYPMPFAYTELTTAAGRGGVALHTVPAPVPYGHIQDQWWSLGVIARENGAELVALSGPCASNGRRSVIKAVQPGFKPYDEAYLSVPPGAIVEKTFFLEAFPVAEEGAGFRVPVRTSTRLFAPWYVEDLPGFAEILRDKYRYAKSRWRERGLACGFNKYPDRDIFVMGWCGQADSPGYALQVLAKGLGAPDAVGLARRSLDFLSGAQFYDGGFHTWYTVDKGEWSKHEPLSQGQAMMNFARAIRVGRAAGADTSKWEAFLRQAANFHSARILAPRWKPLSTAEGFFIAPLVASSKLFSNQAYMRAALKASEVYAARHVSMREPYWGGTLDAESEDKEGAWAAFEGFLALYEATRNPLHLKWAEHASDVVLSYVVVWDIDLPAGRLRDHRFRTRGWTVVSPQNQHIDVYGVIMAPAVYRLGQILHREDLKRMGILMFRSCGQIIDPYGSQGEQPHHTNYAQRGDTQDVLGLRGGYREEWTVFWITAHFLNAGAQFAELGVDVWR
jgi:hypothetical protein